jgi:glycine hydroxymethyltransferase
MLLERYRKQARTGVGKKVYELIEREYDRFCGCEGYHTGTIESLKLTDTEIYRLLQAEYERLNNTLQLTAAQNICSRSVLSALGCIFQNKTSEGLIGARWHGGCEVVDKLESLAVSRAKEAFGAQYANVQPHSGSTANQIVFKALLKPGDTILSLDTGHGGHPSHGGRDSLAKDIYKIDSYSVEPTSFVFDYDKILARAKEVRPRLIMCGASAYPRVIDFEKFRIIADEVGAYLLADISHIAGQVMAGVHPSSIHTAHVTTTSTYKAGGPRGGLVLSGKDYQIPIKTTSGTAPMFRAIDKATFPGLQGTPYFNNIAAKAVFFKESLSEKYRQRQLKIVENAKALANNLIHKGFDVLTGGTDNHMVLVDIRRSRTGLNGIIVQKMLEDCSIVVDSYRLPYQQSDVPASGVRLGTPIVTSRGMSPEQMTVVVELISEVLGRSQIIEPGGYKPDETFINRTRQKVKQLCSQFSWS